MNNLENEVIFEARRDGKCIGFLSIDSTNGRISQVAVAREARNQGIGRQLVQAAQQAVGNKPLAVINAEIGSGLCGFFEKIGFQLTVQLYEMVKPC